MRVEDDAAQRWFRIRYKAGQHQATLQCRMSDYLYVKANLEVSLTSAS